jgi:hypothetical protein
MAERGRLYSRRLRRLPLSRRAARVDLSREGRGGLARSAEVEGTGGGISTSLAAQAQPVLSLPKGSMRTESLKLSGDGIFHVQRARNPSIISLTR